MAKDGIFDQLYRGVVDAIKDGREKVVEEAWYGRALSDRESATPEWPQAQEQEKEASFGGFTRNIDVGRPTHDQLQGNGNYRDAAIEPERNGPQWPKANGHAQNIEQERDRNAERDMDR